MTGCQVQKILTDDLPITALDHLEGLLIAVSDDDLESPLPLRRLLTRLHGFVPHHRRRRHVMLHSARERTQKKAELSGRTIGVVEANSPA